EQLGWRAPQHIVAPMASGSMYTKIWKGLQEFHKVGLIDEPRTRMSGAQAEGCSPIATAFANETLNFVPQKPKTIAKSLAIGNPADGYYALKQMQETGGGAAMVTDAEIVEGIKLLAETEGVFAETAGGVTIACLRKLVASGFIPRQEETVAVISGGGLKTLEAVADEVEEPLHIQPTVESFVEARGARSGQPVTA
ncbi:MAG: pyridoxal-phosphate dependent enzyme, partial [Dehalococcoidia bacterium]